MKFKTDEQRKAVMAKLHPGSGKGRSVRVPDEGVSESQGAWNVPVTQRGKSRAKGSAWKLERAHTKKKIRSHKYRYKTGADATPRPKPRTREQFWVGGHSRKGKRVKGHYRKATQPPLTKVVKAVRKKVKLPTMKRKSIRRKPKPRVKPTKRIAPRLKVPKRKPPVVTKKKKVKVKPKLRPKVIKKRIPTGRPMSKGLQVYLIKKQLKKRGIEPDVVDVEALTDSKLNLEENTKNILRAVGKRKPVEPEVGRRPEIEKSEEAMLEDAKERIAKGENGRLTGFVEGYERRKEMEEF